MITPPRRPRPAAVVAGIALLAAMLAGCGGGADDATDPTRGDQATALATPSASAASTADATPEATPDAAATATAEASPAATPRDSLPPEAPGVHGAKAHVVFLAVAKTADDEKLTKAQAKAAKLGYQGGIGDIECTHGAREALKLKPEGEYYAYSIFFATKKQAQRFADAYGPVVGIAYVTTGCMD